MYGSWRCTCVHSQECTMCNTRGKMCSAIGCAEKMMQGGALVQMSVNCRCSGANWCRWVRTTKQCRWVLLVQNGADECELRSGADECSWCKMVQCRWVHAQKSGVWAPGAPPAPPHLCFQLLSNALNCAHCVQFRSLLGSTIVHIQNTVCILCTLCAAQLHPCACNLVQVSSSSTACAATSG